MRPSRNELSRRRFLFGVGVAPFIPSFVDSYRLMAAPAQKRVKITNIQTMATSLLKRLLARAIGWIRSSFSTGPTSRMATSQ